MSQRIRVVATLLGFGLASPALAWDPAEHRRIVDIAIEHVPPRIAAFLRANRDEVVRGALDPDRKFMDTENHTVEIADGSRRNPERVAELSAALVAMLRNGAPRERVAYGLGALSHYVSDIDEPLHTSDVDKNENWYHPLFEAQAYGIDWHLQTLGFALDVKLGDATAGWEFHERPHETIDDVRAWQLANARWSHGFYDEIGHLYTRQTRDPGRLAEIYRTCTDEAIDDVIDLWSQIDRSAGVDPSALPDARDVFVVTIDANGRVERDGRRFDEAALAASLRAFAAAHATPSAYAEIDDRCDASVARHFRERCAAAGVSRASSLALRMGPATSRLYRSLRVHVASLFAR
jgi:hypothetical protein